MIPRSLFYPNAPRSTPVPIGINQTAPTERMAYLLAELAVPKPGITVLEIGTGSGYQAAVMADCGAEVCSIELPSKSEPRLQSIPELRHFPIYLFRGDGKKGWPYPCMFDAILVTCAAKDIRSAWVEQLKDGGRLIVPRRTSEVEVWRKSKEVDKAEVNRNGLTLERVACYAKFTEME